MIRCDTKSIAMILWVFFLISAFFVFDVQNFKIFKEYTVVI